MRRLLRCAVLAAAVCLASAGCGDETPTTTQPVTPRAPVAQRPAPPRPERHGAEDTDASAASELNVPLALGDVDGTVVAGDAEAPVADFPVFLLGAFTADDLPLGETRTAADGTFAFRGVPAGGVRLVAMGSRDGAEQRVETTVTVAESATAKARLRLVAPGTAGPDGIDVQGRAVWTDTGDAVKRFEFMFWRPDGNAVHVLGKDGKFRARLAQVGAWTIVGAAADGEKDDALREEIVIPAADEIVLRFHRAGDATLRVVDAESRAPLVGARAYRGVFDMRVVHRPGHQVPSAKTTAGTPRASGTDGRIALGRGTGLSEWYVVAEGHEWLAVAADHGLTEPQEVPLRRGGSLRLSIPRWKDLDEATVDQDDPESDRAALPSPDAKGDLVVEGLLPGKREIVVRRGEWYEDGVVYGKGEVEIVAGAEARLTIDANPVDQRKRVALTAAVVVSDAWGTWPRMLVLHGSETANADSDRYVGLDAPPSGRTMQVAIKDVPEGRYRLEIHPFQWRRLVVVGPGPTHWDLDLDAPAEIVVSVLDDAGGKAAPGAAVSWYTLLAGETRGSAEKVERAGADGTFLLRVPPGPVHVGASATGLVFTEQTVEAAAGARSSVTLRLQVGATLIVKLESDGRPFVALEPTIYVFDSEDAFSRRSQHRNARQGVVRFDGVTPGTYDVSAAASDLPGWTCADADDVVVKSGETTTVVLKLEKKP